MVNVVIIREVDYYYPSGRHGMEIRPPTILWQGYLEAVPRVGEIIVLDNPDDAPQEYTVKSVRHHPHPEKPLVVLHA